MFRITFVIAGLLCALAQPASGHEAVQAVCGGRHPRVQVAILLDTSNSMDGLIGQAKTELWRIVNEIARYQRGGCAPDVEVGLYEYGKASLAAGEGYLRMVSPLTTNLDKISEALFALQTNGGDEYCGMVIDRAVDGLQWSRDPDDYRAIFIAGNEPFTQGRVDYREAVAKALKNGITVNTIHCGSMDEGVTGKWRNGADLGRGNFMAIDQDVAQTSVATPYDAEIAQLGDKLSETYVGYGAGGRGRAAKERQVAQDANSKRAGGSASVERAMAKSKSLYKAEEWDLVDAAKANKAAPAKMAEAELPDEMKPMSAPQREAYVSGKAKDRETIQKKLADLDKQRRKFIEDARAKSAAAGEKSTFDAAMRKALKVQMTAKKFLEAK